MPVTAAVRTPRTPGGESWCDVILRLRSVFDMLQIEFAGERLLIMAHQVTVNCLRCLVERMDEAQILGIDRQGDVPNCSVTSARRFARRWQAIVALKGACTVIAGPDGSLWRHHGGNAGLGASGSGDVLAGVVTGLLARGADPPQAAAWGVALHARAGEVIAMRSGPLGYLARELSALARELSAEIPRLMQHPGS